MSWETVRDSLSFYSASNLWNLRPDVVITQFSANDEASVREAIWLLYHNSPTAMEMLETLASQGPIRLGAGDHTVFAPSTPVERAPDSVNYVALNVGEIINGISSEGTTFVMPLEVKIVHELGHWLGNDDLPTGLDTTNADLNLAGAELVGENVREVEWVVDGELGVARRATYHAAFNPSDSRGEAIQAGVDYNGDTITEVVRVGDFQKTPGGNPIYQDFIDGRNLEEGKNMLAFGGRGADEIHGGTGDDWLYGGKDDDRLEGGKGKNHLFGDDGNDTLIGSAGDVLTGGAGSDTFILKTEAIWLRKDGVDIHPFGGEYWDTDRYTLIVGGIVVDYATYRSDGDADVIAIPKVTITDLSADDKIIVDGKLIHGYDVEIHTSYTEVVDEEYTTYYGGVDELIKADWSWRTDNLDKGEEDAYGNVGYPEKHLDLFRDGQVLADDYTKVKVQSESYEFGSSGLIRFLDFSFKSYLWGEIGDFESFNAGLDIQVTDFAAGDGGINTIYNQISVY